MLINAKIATPGKPDKNGSAVLVKDLISFFKVLPRCRCWWVVRLRAISLVSAREIWLHDKKPLRLLVLLLVLMSAIPGYGFRFGRVVATFSLLDPSKNA